MKKTRALFLETISNPKMNVPDITKLVEIAREKRETLGHGIAVIVDGTVTTPHLFKGKEFGVDLVIHSSTKLISGGATSIGGVIVDLGNCQWSGFPSLEDYKKLGELSFGPFAKGGLPGPRRLHGTTNRLPTKSRTGNPLSQGRKSQQ